MKRFTLIALFFIGIIFSVSADQRVNTSTYETPSGQLMALYTLNQGPGPFQIINPPSGAVFIGPNRWAIPVPKQGLPPLQFRVGNQVHRTVAVNH